MNIIIIHAHDAGRAVQPYGFPVHTPNISAIAEEGVFFKEAFCAAPTCSPSRAAMLTGLYPHEVNMIGLAHRGFALSPVEKHLSSRLKDLNYSTALAGIQHEVPDWEMLRYDEYIGKDPEASLSPGFEPLDWDSSIAEALTEWIQGKDPHEPPFYLFWGLFEPHRPFPVADRPFEDKRFPLYGLPDTDELRTDLAGYKRGVEHTDLLIGKVLKALKDQGLYHDSLIIVTTDHGIAFPGYKCTLSDRGTGVELMIRFPEDLAIEGIKNSIVIEEPVSHLDIIPTIHELLGVDDKSLRGKSLISLIKDDCLDSPFHEYLFSEITYHAAYEPVRAIRSSAFKLIRRFTKYPFLPSNIDNSPAKIELLGEESESGLFEFSQNTNEFDQYEDLLYDLQTDPDEEMNLLVGDQLDNKTQEVYHTLVEALESWMVDTHDPLCSGTVSPPEGALVSRSDAYSPKGLYR